MYLATLAIVALALLPAPPATPARVGAEQALIDADLAFAAATAERGREGWLSHFAEDAAIFPAAGPIVRGLAAIRAHYEATGFTGAGLSWTPVHAELAASGDLGYTFGTWLWLGRDASGAEIRRTGKYTTVWRRQASGAWKVVLDIGSPDTDATGQAAP